MSSSNSTDTAVASLLQLVIPENYLEISAAVIALYDMALTFTDDIDLLWSKRPRKGVFYLSVLNRVSMLVWSLAQLVTTPNYTTVSECKFIILFTYVGQFLGFFNWAVFSTLRMYAIAGRARFLAYVVALLSLLAITTTLYENIVITGFSMMILSPTQSMCSDSANVPLVVSNDLAYAADAAGPFADFLILVVTWWTTSSIAREARRGQVTSPLTQFLLLDGGLYFLVICIMQFTLLGMTRTNSASNLVVGVNYYSEMTQFVIVSRFLLNLRRVTTQNGAVEEHSPTVSSVHFASSLIEDIGADLNGSFGFSGLSRRGSFVEERDEDGVKVAQNNQINIETVREIIQGSPV